MKSRALSVLAVCLFVSGVAYGQATRTWVSGVGDDANPCSRTAPCKTFAGAISKTAAGGQISALDPGGYGAVTITKSITIDGTGTLASILFSLTNGVNINVGAEGRVVLRGIVLDGAGNGLTGININTAGAKSVILENVTIMNGNRGISVTNSSNTTNLYLSNVHIHNMATNGVNLAPTGAGVAIGAFDTVRIIKTGTLSSHDGIVQLANTTTHLNNVTVFNSAGNGLNLNGSGALSTIENSTFMRNGVNGVHANAAGSALRVGKSTSVQNFGAGYRATAGTIFSYRNNLSSDNGAADTANTLQNFY